MQSSVSLHAHIRTFLITGEISRGPTRKRIHLKALNSLVAQICDYRSPFLAKGRGIFAFLSLATYSCRRMDQSDQTDGKSLDQLDVISRVKT